MRSASITGSPGWSLGTPVSMGQYRSVAIVKMIGAIGMITRWMGCWCWDCSWLSNLGLVD